VVEHREDEERTPISERARMWLEANPPAEAATGHTDSEAYTNSQNTGDPYVQGPPPPPTATPVEPREDESGWRAAAKRRRARLSPEDRRDLDEWWERQVAEFDSRIDHAQHDEEYTRAEPLVTRVEVINQDGRAFTLMEVSNVRLDYQDDGRTLKVFLRDERKAAEVPPPRLQQMLDVCHCGWDEGRPHHRSEHEPAPRDLRTLIGQTVPDHIEIAGAAGMIELWCTEHYPRESSGWVTLGNTYAIHAFLVNHAHGSEVEPGPGGDG
jgi:hypothetical protein